MRLIILAATALTLAGCAGSNARVKVVDAICNNKEAAFISLDIATVQANTIEDSVKREAALSAIRISRAALDKCP